MSDTPVRKRRHALALGAALFFLLVARPLFGAVIERGDVTATLGPTFFIDDALNGGSDTDIHQPAVGVFNRYLNGLLTRNQGPTKVTLTGFGFAAHTSATANDATTVAVSFTYLGADETFGGTDDVVVGTATGTYDFTTGGEYVFVFDTPLTANLNVTGTRFRIVVTPSNPTGDGSLKLKTAAISYQPTATTSAMLSVAGAAVAQIIPQRLNLAKYQTLTASSVNGNRLASYATDGDAGNDSHWQSQNWAFNNGRIDFPFPVEIGSAQIYMGINDTNPLAAFGIQYLLGGTWTTIPGASVTGNTNVERNIVFTSPVTATSFRIIVTDPVIRLREFALFPPNGAAGYPLGTDVNLNLAHQRPAVASAHTAGNFPINAVDGRTHVGSSWQTTTAGVNTLDIDFVSSTKIGSAHLYSGSGAVPALADFTFKSWNGSAWVDIPGGVVTGNASQDRVVTFTTPPTTSRVRLEFTQAGATPSVVRELQIFPANTGNVGYSLGTNINPSGAYANYETFHDAFHQITNVAAGLAIAVAPGGSPALAAGTTTARQTQYQILLNHADGTYRLRNRDSGECLAGAQFSKTPGLPLVDEPYIALPHQDWILEPLGGGRHQLVNAWSGLVLDTLAGATGPGTALVQNAATGATSQQWRLLYDTWAPKKGLGHGRAAPAFNADWNYNWGSESSIPLPADLVYNPMQWGSFNWTYNTGSGPIWRQTSAWRKRGDGMLLMGFNEPDRTDQSNIPVATAVDLWPQLMALDQPLVGPSPADDGTWLTAFTTEAKNRGFRWDYTAIHAYPGPDGNSNGLINKIQSYYDDYGLPVWLTEFSFVDWGGTQFWSEEHCYQTLAEFVWRAETFAPLRKYALFIFTEDDANPQPANSYTNFTPAPRSNSYDRDGNLTAFGKLYAAWDNDATVRTGKSYNIHHRGQRKRMANAATGNAGPGGRTIRTDGAIVNWTLVPAEAADRYYVVSSIDDRRLSHTSGNTAPTLAAATATGSNVEWSLTHVEHGWYYIGHPASNTRLRLTAFNPTNNVATYQMAATTTTDASAQWRFIVPLSGDNTPPVIAPIPDQVANELTPLTFTVSATDPTLPGGAIAYSIIDPPFNSSINSTTGVFTWTATETQGNGSTYQVTIRASDGQLSAERIVNITFNEVNLAPVLASIPAQSVNEGASLTFTAAATDADIPANTLSYSLVGAPAGALIDATTGIFTWTPGETQGPGAYNFTVRVSDGALTHDRFVAVTVTEVNTAPVLALIPAQTVVAGSLLGFHAPASDVDLPSNTLVYSLLNAPSGAVIGAATGVFAWTPSTAQAPGLYNITVWVSDGLLFDEQVVAVEVLAPLPSATVDGDGDGLNDLLEFAFGTDLAAPNATPFRVVGVNANQATLEFTWNIAATALGWRIRHGADLTDLGAWPLVDPGTTLIVRDGDIDRITVTPENQHAPRGFYTLEVFVK